jgi:hypothetical protein
MFRVNQVVRFVNPNIEYATSQGWCLGDLAIVRNITLGAVSVSRVRDSYYNVYEPVGFKALTFVPGDRVRIVGFGPECWSYKWRNRNLCLGELGREGEIGDERYSELRVYGTLCSDSEYLEENNRSCGGYGWHFARAPSIPELIPFQEEFNADFWKTLYLSHSPQQETNSSLEDIPGSDRIAHIVSHVPAQYVSCELVRGSYVPEEDDSPLPEPPKTIYDADE